MNINDIINWCNSNQGFINMILSIATLIISTLAVIISIITAQLPYKRKVDISCGSSIGVGIDFEGIYVTATNVGNRAVRICNMGFCVKNAVYFNKNTIYQNTIILKPGDTTTQYFEKKDYAIFYKNNSKNKRIYAFAKDESGKLYKKYLCKIKELI